MQPLSACSLDDLTDDQREHLSRAWRRIGLGEHASVAAFARLVLELLSLGAPSWLVARASKAMADEIRHATLCFGIARELAGRPAGPGPLDLSGVVVESGRPEPVLERAIAEGCFAETISAAEADLARRRAREPGIRAALDQIAAEEGEHADLSWRLVGWLLDAQPALRPVAGRQFELTLAAYHARPPAAPGATDDAYVEAYGILLAGSRAEVAEVTVRDVVAPRARALLGAGAPA